MSTRFLGRRVYLSLAVVLVSARLGTQLGVTRRTLARWQTWWREQFPLTPLWQVGGARFMPPVPCSQLPGQLIERFGGAAHEALVRLLVWLSPVSVPAAGLGCERVAPRLLSTRTRCT